MDTSNSRNLSFSVSPSELASLIGMPNAPLIIDVRRQAPFESATHVIAMAQRCDPGAIDSLIQSMPPRDVIVYCVYGHQVGQEAAAALCQAGWSTRFLAGGIAGGQVDVDTVDDIKTWQSTRPLTMRKRPDLGVTGLTPSRWITRSRPKIDRIACPWLIRRFIDSRAQFLYVPTATVLTEAKRLNAIAYDTPGAPISHEGDLCSFDALLAAFDLQSDLALAELANIVRAADTDTLDRAPQAAGLLALSQGLSSQYAADDLAMLEAAMPMYDALYAWCRLQTTGQTQTHNWTPESMQAKQP